MKSFNTESASDNPRKVSRPKSVTYPTPKFDCCVVKCGSKNKHQQDMYLEEVIWCAQPLWIILGWTVPMIIWGDPYDHTFTLIINKTCIWAPKVRFGFAKSPCTSPVFNIPGEVGVEIKMSVLRFTYLTHVSHLVYSCLLTVLRYNYLMEILSKDKEYIICLWVLIHLITLTL